MCGLLCIQAESIVCIFVVACLLCLRTIDVATALLPLQAVDV